MEIHAWHLNHSDHTRALSGEKLVLSKLIFIVGGDLPAVSGEDRGTQRAGMGFEGSSAKVVWGIGPGDWLSGLSRRQKLQNLPKPLADMLNLWNRLGWERNCCLGLV